MSLPFPKTMRAGLGHILETSHISVKKQAMIICILDYFLREANNLCLVYLYVNKNAHIDEHDKQSGVSAWSKITADDIKKIYPSCVKYQVLHGIGSDLESILHDIMYTQDDNMHEYTFKTHKYKQIFRDFISVYAQLTSGQSSSSVCEWITSKSMRSDDTDYENSDDDSSSEYEDEDEFENVFFRLEGMDEEWKLFVPKSHLQRVIYNCINKIVDSGIA